MNKDEIILRGIDEIPMFTFNTKTKEFSVLGHKFEGVNSIEDFINYIHNLGKENKELQQKINQLETNRDEAIEYLKGTWIGYCELDCEWFEEVQHKLLSILERGKE